jgi:predicted Fe-Mo cluster-binding NifX family protein
MRLGLTLSHDRLDAPLSEHFGKARWLAVVEPDGQARFLRNEGLSGGWVARAFAEAGVTDVVVAHLGGGAFGHLEAAGIRVWQGDAAAAASDLAARLAAGALPRLAAPPPHDHGAGGHGGGCGCGG